MKSSLVSSQVVREKIKEFSNELTLIRDGHSGNLESLNTRIRNFILNSSVKDEILHEEALTCAEMLNLLIKLKRK